MVNQSQNSADDSSLVTNDFSTMTLEDENEEENEENGENEDEDDEEHDCNEECGFCADDEVSPASMWTKKEMGEFKESIRKEGGDSIIKVKMPKFFIILPI